MKITPATIVYDLLKEYPELEDVLIAMAKPFKKLKNPVLRNTIAKVATLKHISAVWNIPLNQLINKLNTALWRESEILDYSDENYFWEKPDWFSQDKIKLSVNEADQKDETKMTIVLILERQRDLNSWDIIELITSFLPAPWIDLLKSKWYLAWSTKESTNTIKSYFLKK